MNRKPIGIFLATLGLTAFSAVYNFTTTGAQTIPPTPQTERVRQVVSPTPTPTPTPLTKTPPTIVPEVVEDDGVLIIDSDIVNLSVRVVDRNNRPINNLTQQDFKVYEDNVLQPIECIAIRRFTYKLSPLYNVIGTHGFVARFFWNY